MKYNVLHIVHSLEIGGLERVVVSLVNRLDRASFEPSVCCVRVAGELAANLAEPGRLSVLGHVGRYNASAAWRLFRLVRDGRVDLIHSHNLPGLLYGFAAAKLLRIPVVHTQHGLVLREESALLNLIERRMSRSVDAYVCVSRQLEEEVRREIGVRPARLSVVYNGIEISEGAAPRTRGGPGGAVIGSVGRLAAVKNYPLLINAFARVRERYPDCRLELVGYGEKRGELAALAQALSLGGSVTLHGAQSDVPRFLDRFDVFVLPSFSEGHSISLLEAFGRGAVCVASNVGGNGEIIEDGVNGFLFESNDLDGLTETLVRVIGGLGSPEMERLRERGRETVRTRFSMEAMLTSYEGIYRRLLEGRTARG